MNEQKEIEWYPHAPGWRKQITSRQAARDITIHARSIQDQVLILLAATVPNGLTTDEGAEKLGLHVLSVRPRFSELLAMGKIKDSGERRLSSFGKAQIVWTIDELNF